MLLFLGPFDFCDRFPELLLLFMKFLAAFEELRSNDILHGLVQLAEHLLNLLLAQSLLLPSEDLELQSQLPLRFLNSQLCVSLDSKHVSKLPILLLQQPALI